MNKQKMLDQIDAVRAAVEDCLDDQAEIVAINVGILDSPSSVHLSNVLHLGRCFEGINVNIDKDSHAPFNHMSVMAHGIKFFCLASQSAEPINGMDVPAETLSDLSEQ